MIMIYMNTGQNLLVRDTITSEVFMIGYSRDMWPALKEKAPDDSEWIIFDVSGYEPKEIAGVVKSSGGVVLNIGGVDDTDDYIDKMGYGDSFSLVSDFVVPGLSGGLRKAVFIDESSFYISSTNPRKVLGFNIDGTQFFESEVINRGGSQLVYSPESDVVLYGDSRHRYGVSLSDGLVKWSHQNYETVYHTIPYGTDYIEVNRDGIARRRLEDGSSVWSVYSDYTPPLDGYIYSVSIAPDGDLWVVDQHEKIFAKLRASDGALIDSFPVGDSRSYQSATLNATESGLVVFMEYNDVISVDYEGARRWTVTLPGSSIYINRTVTDKFGYVYFSAHSQSVGNIQLGRISPSGGLFDIEAALDPGDRFDPGTEIRSATVSPDGLLLTTQGSRVRVLKMR